MKNRFFLLSTIASLLGVAFVAFRLSDLNFFYEFMMGRHVLPFAPFHLGVIGVLYSAEIFVVFEHLLFNVTNFKYSPSKPPEKWPEEIPYISVLIPTFSESLEIVEKTLLAAKKIDYPEGKLAVLLLDDQGSEMTKSRVSSLNQTQSGHQIQYHSRISRNRERTHFKAGNLNYGLEVSPEKTDAYLLLDGDQMCLPSILKQLVPYWATCASGQFGFVQAPQTFQNVEIDMWDRPCREFHRCVQEYRAANAATMLTGTSALVGKTALASVGQFETATVTEDLVTGALIQGKGFSTFFHPMPVAYGLIPEDLISTFRQRFRWALGSFQFLKGFLFRIPGLSLGQRLTYLAGITRFLSSWAFILWALVVPAVVFGNLDLSLYYRSPTLLALFFFIIFRFFSHLAYFEKDLREINSFAYLNTLYAPVFLFAFLTALVRKRFAFWSTPKGLPREKSRSDFLFFFTPLFLGIINAFAGGILTYRLWISSYPAENVISDFGGLLLFAAFFSINGLSVIPVRSK